MMVIAVCAVLVLVGTVVVVRWGALPSGAGGQPGLASPQKKAFVRSLRSALGAIAVGFASGLAAGALAAGAGGRLIMRLLALTSPDARGQITEAEQIVGNISAAGTLELIGFCAFIGVPTGLLYVLLRRFLPVGRAGAITFGVLLLVLAGTRVEPLRADNLDFVLVGPAWLAVLAFSALVLFHGMLVAALAERMSVAMPWVAPQTAAYLRHRHVVSVGRAVIIVAVLVALPGFAAAIVDIL